MKNQLSIKFVVNEESFELVSDEKIKELIKEAKKYHFLNYFNHKNNLNLTLDEVKFDIPSYRKAFFVMIFDKDLIKKLNGENLKESIVFIKKNNFFDKYTFLNFEKILFNEKMKSFLIVPDINSKKLLNDWKKVGYSLEW